MTTAATKTRTCLRCKGTGFRSTPVAHMGIPGLCYGCDGKGTQRWVSKEQLNARLARSWDRDFAVQEREGKELADLVAFWEIFQGWQEDRETEGKFAKLSRRLGRKLRYAQKDLDYARTHWAECKQAQREQKQAKRGQWEPL